jgi:hypothetical protein
MNRKLTYVPCSFRPIDQPRKILPRHTKHRGDEFEGNSSTNIWSGVVIELAFASNESFSNVTAAWTVPNAYPSASASIGTNTWKDGTYQCSAWVGIDGFGGHNVVHTGTISRVIVSGGKITSQDVWGWLEWFSDSVSSPSSPYQGFQVSPGDTITCTVCTAGAGSTSAATFIGNTTTGQYTIP